MKTITVESQTDSIEIEFTLNWSDVQRAETAMRRALRRETGLARRIWWPLALAVLLVLVGAALVLWQEPTLPLVIGTALLVLAPAVAWVGSWLFRRAEHRAMAKKRGGTVLRQNWVLDRAGLRQRLGHSERRIGWSDLRRIERMGGCIVIFVDDVHYHLVPDRAFVSEHQQLRFVKSLKQGMGARRGRGGGR